MAHLVQDTPPHVRSEGGATLLVNDRAFLSIKWKVILLTSLVLVVVIGSFSAISYLNLADEFENQQNARHQRYEKEITGLLAENSRNLHRLASEIPAMKGVDTNLLAADAGAIVAAFDPHWALLQLQSGIEFIRFYNKSNQLLADWSISKTDVRQSDVISSWVKQVNSTETPLSQLDCEPACWQYAVEPLLVDGKSVGVVVIGASMIDVVLGFKKMSGDDMGLLVKGGNDVRQSNNVKIPNWNVYVAALTNSKQNLSILNSAAREYPRFSSLEDGLQILNGSHLKQIRLLRLDGIGATSKSQFVVISDITAATQLIRSATQKIVTVGILGLLLSEILVFFMLSPPFSRLREIVFTLPLLAGSTFKNFRHSLQPHRQKKLLKDEIDMLDETAIALSYQLEALGDQVLDRTQGLAQQMNALSKERDFVANLLDTAQVIVITQNIRGEVISLNAHGETLLQQTETELQGKAFVELLEPESIPHDPQNYLEEICLGKRDQFRHEAITRCKDESIRHIVWLHSRLTQHAEEDAAVLSVGMDITEHKRAEGRLAWMADHDPLTDLFNRRRFQEELEQMLHLAIRYQRPGALLFFDLDQFKYINDTSGHLAGDTLLKMVSGMLSTIARSTDITGRLGGDEFALILPETTKEGAIQVAKKILSSLKAAELTIEGRTHKVSASVGIALFPEQGRDVYDLLAATDLAMYHVKEGGRDGWHLFSEEDLSRERMKTLVFWKEKIEYGLAHDRFILYFQPIMHVGSKVIRHYEVLLRMVDEDGSILPPAAFISAAEHSGLIHNIDHMVLRKAIAQAAEIRQLGSLSFSINLSAHAFNDPELLPTLERTLAYYGADPTSLIFEITETAAFADIVAARKLMESIRALGCSFALDDFGIGFSSFYYLRQLPIDIVKIDGSFIQNLASSPDDQILVKALCDVARGFGKKTTAEFVENAATLGLLKQLQVDYAQGYFIGKPAPATESFLKISPAV